MPSAPQKEEWEEEALKASGADPPFISSARVKASSIPFRAS